MPTMIDSSTAPTAQEKKQVFAILSQLRPTKEEKKVYVEQQFNRALDTTQRKRYRLYNNLSYYFGDQISDIMRANASHQDRKLWVYNIVQRKIIGLIGALLQNNFNINYMSINGENTTLIQALEDMLESDKNMCNWDGQFTNFIKYGLIEEAIFELTTTTRNSPLGNLLFECTQPGSVIVDPNWRTENSADMIECFKFVYLPPSLILELYPNMEDQIKEAVLNKVRFGRNYEDRNQNFNFDYMQQLGDDYQVIQYSYLEAVRSSKEIDMSTGVELPETTDVEYKKTWLDINKIDVNNVREIEYPKKVCRICTIIPGLLQVPVEDRPHEIQIERLPFFPWSAERINGETRGIVDIIIGIQDQLNKRENMITNIIENSANGAALLDEALVDGDDVLKELIQANWSNPQFKAWVKAGTLSSGKTFMAQLPRSTPPADAFNQVNHLWDALDRVLPVNAAADGRSESRTESGILYSQKQQAILIAQTTLLRGISAILTEMGEAYFKAAKTYYSDVERVFVRPDGSKFMVNEVVPLPTGDIGIRNDVSSLQNLKTLVKMGQDSPNSRFTRRLIAVDMLKEIPPNMPVLRTAWFKELTSTLDLSDEFKDEVIAAIEIEKQVAMAQLDNLYHTSEANAAKAKIVEQDPTGQQQQQAAQGGRPPGVPPQGAQEAAQGPQGSPAAPQGLSQMIQKLLPLMGKAA